MRGTIDSVDEREGLVIRLDAGGLRQLDVDYVREHVEHAYALTGHGMQGATVEWAGLIGQARDFSRNWAYTPLLVEDLRDQLTRAKVPKPTVRKSLMLLQGILRRATVQGLILMNPVQAVPKPKQPPTRVPQRLSPETVERIRAHMLTMWWGPKRGAGRSAEELQCWRVRNATIVSLLAYGACARSRTVDRAGATSTVGHSTWSPARLVVPATWNCSRLSPRISPSGGCCPAGPALRA